MGDVCPMRNLDLSSLLALKGAQEMAGLTGVPLTRKGEGRAQDKRKRAVSRNGEARLYVQLLPLLFHKRSL
jgi:hypothetical protein